MKNTTKLVLALTLLVPLAACSENKAASNTMKDAADKTMAAAESMKAEIAKMTEAPMAEASKSIADLEKKAAAMSGDGKAKLETMIKNIIAKKDDIMKMASQLQGSDIKEKITSGINELKKMISDAMAVK
jgi:hypothetical protein